MTRLKNSLKLKVGLYVMIALTVAVLIFTLMVVRHNREELLQQVITNSGQLSGVVIRSTRFAMLQNQPSHVDQIIQDVGDEANIEKVRILSKDGFIIHSSMTDEIGTRVDQEAEACEACHMDEKSRRESPAMGRSRFFTDQNGKRMLGSTAVIHNEPTCAVAGCPVPAILGQIDWLSPPCTR